MPLLTWLRVRSRTRRQLRRITQIKMKMERMRWMPWTMSSMQILSPSA